MPRTRSLAWSELKLGIIGIVAVLLLGAIILAVGGEGGYWWQRYPLRARFDNVLGLKPGAVVRLSGKEIGQVTAVEFSGAQVEVHLEVVEDVRPLVTTESAAQIGSLSLLGEPIVDITTGRGGTPLADDAYVKTGTPPGSLSDMSATATSSLQQVEQLLADVRAGRGTLGKLVSDDALYGELQAFVANAGAVTRSLNEGRGTLGKLLTDPAAGDALKTSLQNLESMTARINSGQGALGKFLNDEAMGRSLATTMTNVEQVTGKLSAGTGTAGKLLNDAQLYDRLNAMSQKIDAVMSGLQAGEGTAGRLLRDRELYENMNRAVGELQQLLADIRKDPRKFLRVNVSIF